MKSLFFTLLLILSVMGLQAQTVDENTLPPYLFPPVIQTANSSVNLQATDFDYQQTVYWKRYRRLRTWGWSTFGVGVPLTLGGTVGIVACILSDKNTGSECFGTMFFTGAALTMSSVPLLSCAYWNRRKAKKLSIGMTTLSQPSFSKGVSYAPSLNLSIGI